MSSRRTGKGRGRTTVSHCVVCPRSGASEGDRVWLWLLQRLRHQRRAAHSCSCGGRHLPRHPQLTHLLTLTDSFSRGSRKVEMVNWPLPTMQTALTPQDLNCKGAPGLNPLCLRGMCSQANLTFCRYCDRRLPPCAWNVSNIRKGL